MADYIDRRCAIEAVSLDGFEHFGHHADSKLLEAVLETLAQIPAADVAPVVYGQWQGEADGYADGELVYDVWRCSECDYTIDDGTDDPEMLPNYCPNCGAKMREK